MNTEKSNFLVDLLNDPQVEYNEPFYTFPQKMFWIEAVRQFVNSVVYLINEELGPRICYQIVVPTRKDVRFVQHMCRNVKIPVNALPTESNEPGLACELSLFSAENWMTRMMPRFGKSRLTYIFCIVDGIEYDYRIETVLRILERSTNNSRTLVIPGAILGTSNVPYKIRCLETNFGPAYQLEKVKRFQPESGQWDKLEMIIHHIRQMDCRPEVKDILVVTPNMKLAGQLLNVLLMTANLKRSIIMPSKRSFEQTLRGPENGPFKIICLTPSYIYTDRFPTVNCLIDTCLRKYKAGGEDNTKAASKASIAELASIVGIGKSHFTHCLCVDSKKYVNLEKYEKPPRSTREITSTILELENAGINSYPIMTEGENEMSQYVKHYTELVEDKFIEKGESHEPLTQRGRFALATRLSRKATIFLDTVFSQCQNWDDPRPNHYPLFVACLTAVWIDLDGGIFVPALTPAAIATQSEFDWMDSLENFLDIILSFMSETRENNHFNWCVLRGVNYSALLNAVSHVRCLLESIQRSWGVELPRPQLNGEYVERGLAIDDKRELMPLLRQTFKDRQYVCYFGQVKHVNTEELAEFSSCVEHIVKEKMSHSGRVFINASAEQNNGVLDKIVFCE